MDSLPIVVGFGGINAAGCSSFLPMYNPLIIDSLNPEKAEPTFIDLAMHMNLITFENESYFTNAGKKINTQNILGQLKPIICEKMLIRRIEKSHFNVDAVPFHTRVNLAPKASSFTFLLHNEKLPAQIPDDFGSSGMTVSWLKGEELTSTQFFLGLVSMPTDIINSYVLGHVGSDATHLGDGATFPYNLEHAVQDIRSGKGRDSIVGSAEAPITPEIIEAMLKGEAKPIYDFGKNCVTGENLKITENSISIPGYERSVDITVHSAFQDVAFKNMFLQR